MYEIIDIDGTLTTTGNTPRPELVQYVQEDHAQEGTKFIVVSARPDSRLDETKKWLADNKIPYDQIHLNDFPGAGQGPNVGLAFKKFKYEALIKQYGIASATNPDGIDYAIDNDPEVIAMAKDLGLHAVTPAQHLQEEGHPDVTAPMRALQGSTVIVPDYIVLAAQAGVELYNTGLGAVDVTASDLEHGQALASGQIEVEEVGEIERMILLNREKWEDIPSAEDKADPSWPSPWAVFALLYGVDPTVDDSCEAVLGWTDTIVDRAEVDEEAAEPAAEAQPHDTTAEAAPMRGQSKELEMRSSSIGDFTVTETSDGQRTFSGYAALFDSPSAGLPFTEVIKPGAFRRSLSRATAGQKIVAFLFGHDETRALATTASGRLKLMEDAKGLRVEAKLDPADPDAAKVISMLTHEAASSGMSFGFTVPKGGDAWNGEERTLKEVNLIEASILSPGQRAAYPATTGLAAVRKLARKNLGVDGDTLAAALENISAARELTEDQTQVIDEVRAKLGTKSKKLGIEPSVAAAQIRLSAMMNEEI